EPVADRQVVFRFSHRGIRLEVSVALRTDEKGRIVLGELGGIESFWAGDSSREGRFWHLTELARTWPSVIHAKAGETIQIPWGRALEPDSYSLLEWRGDTFVADRTKQVSASGKEGKPKPGSNPAFLIIEKLPPGDYGLRLRDELDHGISIQVTEAVPVQGWLL